MRPIEILTAGAGALADEWGVWTATGGRGTSVGGGSGGKAMADCVPIVIASFKGCTLPRLLRSESGAGVDPSAVFQSRPRAS
jgi:hypothetical protein